MKAVVVTVLVTLLAWTCIAPAQAKQPVGSYLAEFWAAEGFAFLGGLVGWSWGGELDKNCYRSFLSGTYEEYQCELETLVWMNGRTIGAIAGVWLAGSSAGVQGNIWGLVLLPGLGLVASLLADHSETLDLPEFITKLLTFSYAPFVPAALATIGYNIGATMKADSSGAKPSSLELDMPLFSFEF